MEDLDKLLRARKLRRPTEIQEIASWCKTNYPSFTVSVQKRSRDYLITVPNAPLAQEIHMRMAELSAAAKIPAKFRITIRIA